jgi:hypothetical protein
VRGLVVADIAPVAYGHTQQPLIDAMRAVDLSSVERRGDADAQLLPLVPEDGVRAFLLQSLDVAGKTLAAEPRRAVGEHGRDPRLAGDRWRCRRPRRCFCPAGPRTT